MPFVENTLPRPKMSEDVISQYQAHLDRVNLSRDVEISRREFAEGKGIPHRQVMDEMRKMLLNLKLQREVVA